MKRCKNKTEVEGGGSCTFHMGSHEAVLKSDKSYYPHDFVNTGWESGAGELLRETPEG